MLHLQGDAACLENCLINMPHAALLWFKHIPGHVSTLMLPGALLVLISIFRRLSESHPLVRYAPPKLWGAGTREDRAVNLEETHPQPHILLVGGQVCVFHGERTGRDPFRHCLRWGQSSQDAEEGGPHLERPLLLTPSLSLKRLFLLLCNLQAPWWVDPRDSHLNWRPALWLSHSLQQNPSFHENDLEVTL